jgi:hypothetical protein
MLNGMQDNDLLFVLKLPLLIPTFHLFIPNFHLHSLIPTFRRDLLIPTFHLQSLIPKSYNYSLIPTFHMAAGKKGPPAPPPPPPKGASLAKLARELRQSKEAPLATPSPKTPGLVCLFVSLMPFVCTMGCSMLHNSLSSFI